MNRWDSLPTDLRHKILVLRMRDFCATKIQTAFLNWSLLRHRTRSGWDALRGHVGEERVTHLEKYCNVRREWRTESRKLDENLGGGFGHNLF